MNTIEIEYTIAFIFIAIIIILIWIKSDDLNFKNFKDFLGTKPGKFIIYTFLSLLFYISILFIIKGLFIYGPELFGYQAINAINAKAPVKSIHKTNLNFINPGFSGLVAFGTILLSIITVYSLFYNTLQEKRNTALLIKSGLEYFKNAANEFVGLYNFKCDEDNVENYLRVSDKYITRYSADKKPEFNFTNIFDSVISKLGILDDEKLISNFIKVYEIIKSMETVLRDYGEEYYNFVFNNAYLLDIYLPLLEENNIDCFVKYDIFHVDAENYFSIKEKSYTYLYDWFYRVQRCMVRFSSNDLSFVKANNERIDNNNIYLLNKNFSISPFNGHPGVKENLLSKLRGNDEIISVKSNSNGVENILLIPYYYDEPTMLLNKYSFEDILLKGIKPLCSHTKEILKLVNSINIDEIIKDLAKIIK
jgi:hypothetical protein